MKREGTSPSTPALIQCLELASLYKPVPWLFPWCKADRAERSSAHSLERPWEGWNLGCVWQHWWNEGSITFPRSSPGNYMCWCHQVQFLLPPAQPKGMGTQALLYLIFGVGKLLVLKKVLENFWVVSSMRSGNLINSQELELPSFLNRWKCQINKTKAFKVVSSLPLYQMVALKSNPKPSV